MKVFFKVTLPLVKPALMVAVIFRLLDALRIFDLIYVLTPNSSATKTMSIISRENLIDFDNFAYGSAQSTLLFLIIALVGDPLHLARPGRPRRGEAVMPIVKTGLFYLAVVVIVVVSVFPFYYAIITSFKTGHRAVRGRLLADAVHRSHNYVAVFSQGEFPRNILNSVFVATMTVAIALLLAVTASYALARVRFRGRTLLLLTILAVSMFPQIAVLAGLFELIRFIGIFNTPWALILSYTIFTLPFTVWVLTTFMRDLPIEIEEAAIVDGASALGHHHQGLPAADVAGAGDDRAARLHRRLERVPVRADLHLVEHDADGAGGDRAALAAPPQYEMPWGIIMAASVIVTVPLIVLVLIFQRKIVAGLTAGGVKG